MNKTHYVGATFALTYFWDIWICLIFVSECREDRNLPLPNPPPPIRRLVESLWHVLLMEHSLPNPPHFPRKQVSASLCAADESDEDRCLCAMILMLGYIESPSTWRTPPCNSMFDVVCERESMNRENYISKLREILINHKPEHVIFRPKRVLWVSELCALVFGGRIGWSLCVYCLEGSLSLERHPNYIVNL